MTREFAIERAEWQIPHDLARHVVFRTESQVRESRPPLGIYFERGTAPAFRRMGYATEILLYDRLGSTAPVRATSARGRVRGRKRPSHAV
jgi:hypothetical protein